MRLNLPILDQVSNCKNLLIAGMGGGFDVFCGLPIYFELTDRGQRVHLANYSFSELAGLKNMTRLTDSLVGVNADIEGSFTYFPELYLSQWFRETHGEEITIWCFEKTGVRPLIENYEVLAEHLDIDGVILVDGGVDGLMRGDEPYVGTMVEDSISLLAVGDLKNISVRIVASLGMGAEWEVSYWQVFENIATLTKMGAFFGSCSLTQAMQAYQLYEHAVTFVHDKPAQKPSVINSSVISAVHGHYGNHHLTERTKGGELRISPLMATYWFFDLRALVRQHLFYSKMRYTDTVQEAWVAFERARRTTGKRQHTSPPF